MTKTVIYRNSRICLDTCIVGKTDLDAGDLHEAPSAGNPTTWRSRREFTNKHKPIDTITAPCTRSIDFICRQLGSSVWDNYLHALVTTGTRSIAVFLWFRHSVVTLSMFDTYFQLNNFHRQATVTQA